MARRVSSVSGQRLWVDATKRAPASATAQRRSRRRAHHVGRGEPSQRADQPFARGARLAQDDVHERVAEPETLPSDDAVAAANVERTVEPETGRAGRLDEGPDVVGNED